MTDGIKRSRPIESRRRRAASSERWRKAHPDRVKASRRRAAKKFRLEHPEQSRLLDRQKHLKKKYGITPTDWDLLFKAQDGCCAACGCKLVRAYTDHDHKTGAVRALLCLQCNTDIGLIENLQRVGMLQEYLRSFSPVSASPG